MSTERGSFVLPPLPATVNKPGQMYFDSSSTYYYDGSATQQVCSVSKMFATVMANTYWRW